jgi:hypothetical protein
MSDEPAILLVCADCDPARRWPQPFPSVEAARRWRDSHRDLYGHEHVERATPSE